MTYWRTREFSGIRVRMVEYMPGYLADHWCTKGHILLCLEDELETELADGRKLVLTTGISCQVADQAETSPFIHDERRQALYCGWMKIRRNEWYW